MTDHMAQKMDDQIEGAQITQAMFHAAIRDLARISEHLGLEPDDGGAEPIIRVIDELRGARNVLSDILRDALVVLRVDLRDIENDGDCEDEEQALRALVDRGEAAIISGIDHD